MKRSSKRMDATALSACLLAAGLACGAGAAEPTVAAQSQIKDRKGDVVGTAELLQTAGGLLIKMAVKNLQPGQHAIHIHTVGKCEPPFTTAGAHFNPEQHPHGMLAGNAHAGDLPNLHVPDGGAIEVEIITKAATLEKGKPNSLLDNDGSSLVIHATADDYKTNPDGAAGERIACGVITSNEGSVGRSDGAR